MRLRRTYGFLPGIALLALSAPVHPMRTEPIQVGQEWQYTGAVTVNMSGPGGATRHNTLLAEGDFHSRLRAYRETFWVDSRSGALVKYEGSAKLTGPGQGAAMQITTSLRLKQVRQLSPAEVQQREEQARVLIDAEKFVDEYPFAQKEQAAGLQQIQQRVVQFQRTTPNSPYLATVTYLYDQLNRELGSVERDRQQAALVGQAAPAFTLRSLEGKEMSLHALRGRIALLNFFASWCPPCNEEAPHLEREFWQKYRARGLMVVGIDSKETDRPLARARAFRAQHHLTYPILLDADSKVSADYRVQAIPVTVLIDRTGTIRYIGTGFDPDAIQRVLTGLLR